MSTRRRLLLAAFLAAPLALASCGNKKNKEETQPPIDPVPAASADGGGTSGRPGQPNPAVERITVSGSVEGLDDMLAGFKKLGESWMPDQASDPKAEIQAALLGMGFGPGFFNNIDLDGVHAFTSATPVKGGGPQDTSVAASVAVVDARKLIENLPQSQRPSPLGEGMWELAIDSTRLLMREQGKELLLGLSNADVDTASKLRGQAKPGKRVQIRATNIPTDDIDPSAVLEELQLPAGSDLSRQLSEIIRELDAITFETDFGTARDFQAELGATAPFHKLGLGPIGTPRAAATPLESQLPPNPVFVTTLSWGDPALLHKLVDSAPIKDVPDPVKPMVEKAIQSAHGILDQVASDVAFALYLDKKGRATFVMAASVKDEAKTKAALQGVHQVIAEGVATQATMAGKSKDAAFAAKLELDGLKVPGGKADRLTVTIPKSFQGDVKQAKMFLGKNTLELVSNVSDGTAVLAIGAGARTLVTDVAKADGKPRKNSLAQHEGLQGLRKAMGGCQICMSGDPLGYFHFRLLLVRDESTDKAVIKQAGDRISQLGKVSSIGYPGVGVKVEAEQAAVGMVVPQTTVFAPRSSVEKLTEINAFVSDPASAMAAKEEPKKPAAEKKPAKKAG